MTSTTPAPPATTGPWVPVTPALRALDDARRLDPTSAAYVVADVLEVHGPVDARALAAAVRDVAQATPALRVEVDGGTGDVRDAGGVRDGDGVRDAGGARVRVGAPRTVDVPVVDLRDRPDPVAAAHAWVDADLDAAAGDVTQAHAVLVVDDTTTWWYQRYHHLLVDGYAVAALARRVAERYRARATDAAAPQDAPQDDLGALWAQEHVYGASDRAAQDRAFFLDLLGDAPPRTRLVEGAAAALRRARRARVPLDASSGAALAGLLTAEPRLTWADVHAAAWAAFVGRRTGLDDVVLGLPVAARLTPEALRTVSLSVNVVPLRCAPARGTTLRALAHEVARTLAGVRRHQRARGEELAARYADATGSWLLRGPGLNLKPFVETVRLGDAVGRLRTVTAGPVDDVDLTVVPDDVTGVRLELEANPDLLDAAGLDRLAAAYAAFLADLLHAPDLPLGRVPAEVVAPPVAPASGASPADVSDVLAATTAAAPDVPALRDARTTLDRRALRTRVRSWATGLRAAGVGPEDVVALALPRGADLVVALLAVLEAGAAFTVLDLEHPDERVDDLLADTAPVLVVTTPGHRLAARPDAATVRDGRLAVPPTGRTPVAPSVPHPASTAYVVHTSGSTGRPKGVAVSRGSLAFLLDHHRRTLHGPVARAAGRRLLALHTASFAFDSSWEQLLWLLLGHELLVLDEDDRRDAHEIVATVERERVDAVDVTPSLAAALVDAGVLGTEHRLSLFLIGGEAAPAPLWRRLAASGVRSHNLYGPTEATVDALGAPVTGDRPTIGVPLVGTAVRVLDAALQPVRTGELYLAGPHLARGYRGRPDATADRFVADPWGAPGARMYRTGDLVRVEDDGTVTYLGRTDDQVKVRGHRVELGEVRAALADLPGVRQAFAQVVGDPARLVGYVVGDGLDGATVRAALAARVPDHLVPSAVVVLDALPTTVQGKVDAAALPLPAADARGTARPAGPAEAAVCAAFAEVLGVPDVAADDDFFLLGGDSISAIAVAARLRRDGLRLRPRDVFGARTPRDLAPLLTSLATQVDGLLPPAPADVAATGAVPVPPVVADVLALADDTGAFRGYAHSVRVPLPGGVDDTALRAALAALVDLHPALRTRLEARAATGAAAGAPETGAPEAGAPARTSVVAVGTTTPVTDRTAGPHPEGDPAPARGSAALVGAVLRIPATGPAPVLHRGDDVEALRPALVGTLDPAAGVLLAAGRAGDVLVLAVHHLAVDGVSWRVLRSDLDALLRGERPAPEATPWRARATALAGLAPHVAGQRGHWDTVLGRPCDLLGDLAGTADLTPGTCVDVPAGTSAGTSAGVVAGDGAGALDVPGAAPGRGHGGPPVRTWRTLPADVTHALVDDLPRALGVTPDVVVAAAVLRAVAAARGRTGGARALLTWETHGRDPVVAGEDTSRTVGWFTTEFPVAVDVPVGDASHLSGRVARETGRSGLIGLRSTPEPGLVAGPSHEADTGERGAADGRRDDGDEAPGSGARTDQGAPAAAAGDGEPAATDVAVPVPTDVAALVPTDVAALVATAAAVARARAAVPGDGVGFGVLAGGGASWAHRPQLLVNHLGRLGADGFAVHVPAGLRAAHAVEVNTVVGDDGTLAVEWTLAPGAAHLADALAHAFSQVADVARGAVDVARLLRAVDGAPVASGAAPRVASTGPLPAGLLPAGSLPVGPLAPAACTLPGVTSAALAAVTGRAGPLRDVAPLSPLQEGLLALALRDGDADVYRTRTTVHLRADDVVDLDRLHRALDAVCAAHPQLLAVFDADTFGASAQVVAAAARPRVTREDLTHLPPDASAAVLAAVERVADAEPFDVTTGPLLRAVLVRTAPGAVAVVLTAHHLVLDGWSTPVLVEALVDAYASDAPLPDGYAAYRAYLRAVHAQDRDRGLAAWAAHLGDVEPCLLAGGRAGTGEPITTEVALDAATTTRLTAAGRAAGLTLSTLVTGAWALVLARETARPDVVLGSTVAGRALEVDGLDEVVGLLSTTVPVRLHLVPDRPLAVQLAEHQARRAALGEHETYGLADVEATTGRTGLFDTLVVVENYPHRPAGTGLRVTDVTNAGGTHYPVSLTVLPGERLRALVEHDPARVDAARARRLGTAFVAALTALADDPTRTPLDVDLAPCDLAPRDDAPGGTPPRVDPGALVGPDPQVAGRGALASFLAAVAGQPDAPALTCGDVTLTFARVADRAAAFAQRFAALGLAPDDVVGIALPRGTDVVAAILGCLAHGVAYLPLDLAHPADRLRAAVAEAGAVALVTSDLDVPGVPRVDPGDLAPATGPLAARDVPGTTAAYVILTSGSTGRPKATVLTRDGLDRHHEGLRTGRHADLAARVAESDGRRVRALHTASFAFDTSLIQLHWLLAGHELEVLDEDDRRDPAAIVARVHAGRGDVLDVAPVLAEQLVAEGLLDGPHPLPELFLGGEAVPPALWAALRAHPGTRTVNLYGPTEATVDALGAHADEADVPVVGRPVAGITARVLDRWLRPVPVGVTGELYLAGPQLARGYAGRPGLTAERFVADPYGPPGTRAYRTGDAVRVRPDGLVDFVGRWDDQVKVGGHRVETGEVVALLEACPGVRSAAVVVDGAHTSAARLVAAVTRDDPAAGAGPAADTDPAASTGTTASNGTTRADDAAFAVAVRADLAARAPHHLVPAVVAVVAELPTTVTGKVDRDAVRRLAPALQERDDVVAPTTPAQAALVAAATDVLGVPVSATDDLFALGAHSLTALRLLGRLRERGWRGTVRAVFEHRRVDAIAARLVPVASDGAGPTAMPAALPAAMPATTFAPTPAPTSATTPGGTSGPDLDRVLREGGEVPVSAAQRRLLVLEQIDGAGDTWTVPVALALTGDVDAVRLHAAWQAVVDRHAVLRTRYAHADGSFTAHVEPVGTATAWEHRVLAAAADVDAAVAACRAHAFDVHEVPVRATLLQGPAGRWALVLAFHHLVVDDWSVATLLADLSAAYRGEPLPALPAVQQHASAVVAEAAALADAERLAAGRTAWRDRLAGLPAEPDLPWDAPRPDVAEHRGRTVALDVPRDVRDALADLCAADGVTPVMVLQTAVATLYRRLGAGGDVCLGMAVAHREDPALAAAVGYLVDTVPVRLDVSGAGSFRDLVARTRACVLDALEDAWVPFEQVVEAVAPQRSLTRHPLFQTMVAVEQDVPHALDLPGVDVVTYPGDDGAARLDVAVRWVDAADPRLVLTVDAALLDDAGARTWAQRLLTWLRRVLAAPDAPLTDLDALLPAERAALGADHVRRPQPPASVVDRVADQVLRTPHATALVASDGAHDLLTLDLLTLGARAAAVADALRARGIGHDDVVAVAVGRHSGLVAALLGVLGAGATYVPLDVEYPAERLGYMLDDAAPALVVTDTGGGHVVAAHPDLPVLDVDALDVPERTAQQVADALRAPVGPHGAYTIYTSGSTGRPKGVVIPSDAMAAFVDHVAGTLRTGPGDRLVAVTTVSFDIAVLELFVPLVTGAAVVLADRAQVRDPDLLARLVRRERATHLQATPSLWRPLVEAHPDAFAGVHALVGGEALPPDLADALARACASVTNVYGPTEVTVWATSDEVRDGQAPTIGRPYTDVGTLVLDADLRPVPDGAPGELYLTGAQLARGYHARPGLTAGRFVAVPHDVPGVRAGERMYRTGDLVRRLPDGRLRYVRRTDDQVKVNGFRIELGEVETALRAVPGVRRAAAVVRADAGGAHRLLGYVVPDEDVAPGGAAPDEGVARTATVPDTTVPDTTVPDTAVPDTTVPDTTAPGTAVLDPVAVRAHLAARLPAQLVPHVVTVLDALPLTLNGKVDRHALPDPVVPARATGRAPATPAEAAVCDAVRDVLGVDATPDDAFFELGGDSITAIRVVAGVRARGFALAPRDVFAHPGLADLAAAASPLAAADDAPATPAAPATGARRRTRVALSAQDLSTIGAQLGGRQEDR